MHRIFILVLLYSLTAGGLAGEPASVVLISLDGYRHDYSRNYRPPQLLKQTAAGTCAKGLIPPFPSFTYPSHLSMITGLYPARHGIVSGDFIEPDGGKRYQLRDRESVRNPTWYSGASLWALLHLNQMTANDYFWPGGETQIGGAGPKSYFPYAHTETHEKRIAQVIEWLALPASERPRLITLYFHEVDSAGNEFGPQSKEVEDAIQKVDESLGRLWEWTAEKRVPVNFILVSDHGMKSMDPQKTVPLQELSDLSGVTAIRSEALASFYVPDEKKKEKLFSDLVKHRAGKFHVFKYPGYPRKFTQALHRRLGDVVVVSRGDYSLQTSATDKNRKGVHGFHPQDAKEMLGIFCAWGPNIKRSPTLSAFSNVDVFPFIARLLDVKIPHKIDGRLNPGLRKILK